MGTIATSILTPVAVYLAGLVVNLIRTAAGAAPWVTNLVTAILAAVAGIVASAMNATSLPWYETAALGLAATFIHEILSNVANPKGTP